MKIGIINVYNRDTINYGNVLQTYALNLFLRNTYPKAQIETILYKGRSGIKCTSYIGAIKNKIIRKLKAKKSVQASPSTRRLISDLTDCFRDFADNNIVLSNTIYSLDDLKNSDYDSIIVGSDVVWMQSRCLINRILFLDFDHTKTQKKISYAASFGRNYIPKENRKFIKRCLGKFSAISVRESKSVSLLEGIGVLGVKHVLDPTLLLLPDMWKTIERVPVAFETRYDSKCKYAFIYLLKQNSESFKQIISFCQKNDLIAIFVPCIDLSYDSSTNSADLTIEDCSPTEWLWLIHHAECVITDSFHGVVLSTIYKVKFFVISRIYGSDLNIRTLDYLQLIKNEDKMIDLSSAHFISDYEWDYENIDKIIKEKRDYSIEFLRSSIEQVES